MTPLEQAIKAVGGLHALASAVGVSSTAPSMWKSRGRVPAEYCPLIERATRAVAAEHGGEPVTCEQLRPDVAWDVLRMQASPAPVISEARVMPAVRLERTPAADHPRRRSYEQPEAPSDALHLVDRRESNRHDGERRKRQAVQAAGGET